MSEDLFLKYLRKDLKPYIKEGDCCTGIVKLRKEIERLNNIINEAIDYMERFYSDDFDYCKNELLEILKGETNE